MKVYLVGGAVRDSLLGKVVQDRDYVVLGSSPEQMLQQGFLQVGKDFPVFLHPKTRFEYALARTERKSGKGYKGFEVFASPEVTLEDDLKRRDITINAMAQDEEGNIIDPCGGKKDLEKKIIRHVTDAFAEDPLRVLRVARFHARLAPLGFTVALETLDLMRAITMSGELDDLVSERVWVEINKSLMEEKPSQFFLTLKECGALKVLLPEIDNLFGVPQRKDYHPEIDTGVHTMMVIDQAAKLNADSEVRFAALVHDLGKADTAADVLPSHHGHEKKSVTHINAVCNRYKIPRAHQKLAVLVAEYHGISHRAFELKATTILELFEKLDAFRNPERLPKFLLACKADSLGRGGCEENDYPQENYFQGLYDACKKVDTREFIEKGLEGSQIAEAIRKRRLSLIKENK